MVIVVPITQGMSLLADRLASGAMAPRWLDITARPSRGQVIATRLRLYLRSGAGLQWTACGLLGPPALWLLWRAVADRPWPSGTELFLVAGPIAAIALPALTVLTAMRHPQTRAYLRDGARYTLTDGALELEGALGEGRLPWECCARAYEFADLFVLCLGTALHLVPKAQLEAGEAEVLRGLLRDRLGKRASLRSA